MIQKYATGQMLPIILSRVTRAMKLTVIVKTKTAHMHKLTLISKIFDLAVIARVLF